jgi:hypothetical protein
MYLLSLSIWLEEQIQATGLYQNRPVVIQMTIISIVILVLLLIIIYTILFNRKLIDYINDLTRAKWTPLTQNLLIEIISETQDLPRNKTFDINLHMHKFEPFKLHKRQRIRKILIHNIIDLGEQLSGNTKKILLYIYLKLNLQKDAIKDLSSSFPGKVIRAIKEISKMGYILEEDQMHQLLMRKNKHVYHAARTYYFLNHSDFSIDILIKRGERLTPWDEIELFNTISQFPEDSVPEFSKWINANIPEDLVALSVRLAVHFYQFEAVTAMVKLLDTSSDWLKERLINAMGKLMQTDYEEMLINRYPTENNPVIKKEILKALGRTGGELSPDFLVHIFLEEEDFSLKRHAALSAFKSMPMDEIKERDFFKQISPSELELIKYIKNPLVNFN